MNSKLWRIVFVHCVLFWFGTANGADFTVSDTSDAVDAKPGDGACATAAGKCSLRAAIQETNALAGTDQIIIPPGTYQLTLGTSQEDKAASGDLDITDSLAISGQDQASTIIDGLKTDRIFDIHENLAGTVTVNINQLTLQNGAIDYNMGAGGAIYNDATLLISKLNVKSNAVSGTDGVGGAIYNSGTLVMNDSVVEDNQSTVGGGGAIFSAGNMQLTNVTAQMNHGNYGGGIFVSAGTAVFDSVTIKDNHSIFHGAGIHLGLHGSGNPQPSLTIQNSHIEGNMIDGGNGQQDPQGAGIFVTADGILYVGDSIIKGNDARSGCAVCLIDGGGIYNGHGHVTLNRVQLLNNSTARWGGGIYTAIDQPLTIYDSIVSGNSALGIGGGIASEYSTSAEQPARTIIERTLIDGNTATFGGGIAGSARISNSTISRNQSLAPPDSVGGGGVVVPPNAVGVPPYFFAANNVTFAENTATVGAPQIANAGTGIVQLKGSIVGAPAGTPNCVGTITSVDFNVVGDVSCATTAGSSDKLGDPLLVGLADNGGSSGTYALNSGSPALGLIPADQCPSIDQRDYPRGTGACDAGALESGATAAQRGSLSLGAATNEFAETAGGVSLTVNRANGTQGAVSIDFLLLPLSAEETTDFTASAIQGTLEWADGDNAPKAIHFDVVNDRTVEADKIFTAVLRNPGGGATLATPRMSEVKLVNDDHHGTLVWETTTVDVKETAGNVVLKIKRENGDVGAVTVKVTTSDGTAIGGSSGNAGDYTALSQEVAFADGQTEQIISVSISDDTTSEPTKTFSITLSQAGGGASLGSENTASVSILDNDRPGTIQFAAADYSIIEGQGNLIITLQRIDGDLGDVTVAFSTVPGGSATAGTIDQPGDYIPTTAIVAFANGTSTATVVVPIQDDAQLESPETFQVHIADVTGGALLGTIVDALVTIQDDEAAAAPGALDSGGGGGSLPFLSLAILGLVACQRVVTSRRRY